MFLPRLYISLVPLLYGIVFVLPLFTVYFQHQGQTAAFFLLSFYWALVSVFWPGLRPRHLLLTVPALLLVFPLLRFLPVYDGVVLILDPRLAEPEFIARLPGDFLLGLGLQTFSALVAAAGLSFQAKRARLVFRRAALDEEEMETLFEITRAAYENPDLSYYRYKTMLGYGFSLVAEQHGKILGVVHALLLKESLFLYSLTTIPTAQPELKLQLLQNMLRRGELPAYPGMSWFFWDGKKVNEGDEVAELLPELQHHGFHPLQEKDPRLTAAQELLSGGLGQALPMAIPLGPPRTVWLREIVPA